MAKTDALRNCSVVNCGSSSWPRRIRAQWAGENLLFFWYGCHHADQAMTDSVFLDVVETGMKRAKIIRYRCHIISGNKKTLWKTTGVTFPDWRKLTHLSPNSNKISRDAVLEGTGMDCTQNPVPDWISVAQWNSTVSDATTRSGHTVKDGSRKLDKYTEVTRGLFCTVKPCSGERTCYLFLRAALSSAWWQWCDHSAKTIRWISTIQSWKYVFTH